LNTAEKKHLFATRDEENAFKQKVFAREYVNTGKVRASAEAAGYSTGPSAAAMGSRLLKYESVQAEITRLNNLHHAEEKIDRLYVLHGLYELAENATRDSDRIRALELLGKTLRMFVDHIETTVTHDITQLEEFTLDQLRSLREMPQLEGKVTVEEILPADKSST